MLLAGSLWQKDSELPCTERSYYRRPYAIKAKYKSVFSWENVEQFSGQRAVLASWLPVLLELTSFTAWLCLTINCGRIIVEDINVFTPG